MKYDQKSFSVGPNDSEARKNFVSNWDATFSKKCQVCGQLKYTDNPCDDPFHLPEK